MRTALSLVVFCFVGWNTLYADPLPKDDKTIPKIKGTTWKGDDTLGTTMTCTFLDDGTLEYSTGQNTWKNGSWKQDGKKVTWETNNHYADYTGIVSKNEMKMEAKNVTGLTWTITLKPAKDEAKGEKKP